MATDGPPPAAAWVEFGQHLRHWRRMAGLTQAQIGRRIGYHHSVISKVESGDRRPSSAMARHLDEILHTGGEFTKIFAAAYPPAGPR